MLKLKTCKTCELTYCQDCGITERERIVFWEGKDWLHRQEEDDDKELSFNSTILSLVTLGRAVRCGKKQEWSGLRANSS